MKGFISYSHKDAHALTRLHDHMAVLHREGLIETWFDRNILAGQNIDFAISEKLHESNLFLLLVSPDFLASPYCTEMEMQRALGRHANGSAIVVPIIIEPCDWHATPLGSLKALPRDGQPISTWSNENAAYQDVVSELRRLILSLPDAPKPVHGVSLFDNPLGRSEQSTRYRAQKDFGAIDQAEFAQAAFDAMREHFEANLKEVEALDGVRTRFLSISATSFTCSIENRNRYRDVAHITVHCSNEYLGVGDITYCFQANAPLGTSNGWFSVEHDEYEMFIASTDFRNVNKRQMNPSEAAEMLWHIFLEQAGISYA